VADILLFPAPGVPLPTADVVVVGHARGVPAGTPWPNGIPVGGAASALPPEGSAYVPALGATLDIPANGYGGPIRTSLLDTPGVLIEETAADRLAEAELAAHAPADEAPPGLGMWDDVLAGLDKIPAERLAALTGGAKPAGGSKR
jgi:hypothetical protein